MADMFAVTVAHPRGRTLPAETLLEILTAALGNGVQIDVQILHGDEA